MRDVMDFCIYILTSMVGMLFDVNIGGYSVGDFLLAVVVISVFVSSLVVSFRKSNSFGRTVKNAGIPSKSSKQYYHDNGGGSGSV